MNEMWASQLLLMPGKRPVRASNGHRPSVVIEAVDDVEMKALARGAWLDTCARTDDAHIFTLVSGIGSES